MMNRNYTYKPQKLSELEVELFENLTRRRFIIGMGRAIGAAAAATIGQSGCGPTEPSSAPSTATNTPASTVVALDEFAGLSALSLGIAPARVFLTFGYSSAKAVFDFAGVSTTPAAPDGVNLEAVAALKPEVIVGVSLPTTVAVEDKLNVIAPTTVIEYTASWQEQTKTTGAAVGRLEAADALIRRLEGAIAALKSALSQSGAAGQTVSVIGVWGGSDVFALSRTGLVGSILDQVGLKRPAVQDVVTEPTSPFITISFEQLEQHDADLIFLMSGGAYQSDTLTSSALWSTLDAVKVNKVFNVVAELWLSSNAFSVDWIVRDVRAALLNDGSVAAESDVVSRWQSFVSTQS